MFWNICFLNTIKRITTKIGDTILAVLNVYMERTKDITDKNNQPILLLERKNVNTPKIIKKDATFASNAARESIICQGEIAKIALVKSAIVEEDLTFVVNGIFFYFLIF